MEENWRSKIPTTEGPTLFPAPNNFAVRGMNFIYDRYRTGDTEYYDLTLDPFELESKQISVTRKENLDRTRTRLRTCRGAECLSAEGP